MGKLHMKRTPAEQAEHDLRKARKAARKAAKRARRHAGSSDDEGEGSSYAKRQRTAEAHGGDFDEDRDLPAGHAHKPDQDYIYAQVEEERFREKMWGAFEDDERLDSVEARFNNYAHIPRRWRSGGMDRMDDEMNVDPQMMEEEDYAEWVRANMWKWVPLFVLVKLGLMKFAGSSTRLSLPNKNARRRNELRAKRVLKLWKTRRASWRRRRTRGDDSGGQSEIVDDGARPARYTRADGRSC